MSRKIVSILCGLLTLGLLACAPRAHAAPWVTIAFEPWNAQLSGNIYDPQDPLSLNVDLRDDLGMGRRWNPNFMVAFATPAYVPDITVEYGNLMGNGSSTVHGQLCFNGVCYDANGLIVSQLAIKEAMLLFEWSAFDNSVLNLRLGFDFHWVNMNITATGTVTTTPAGGGPTSTTKESTSSGVVSWLPGANLALTVHLPANFDVYFNGRGLSFRSSYLYDLRLGIMYHFDSGLSLGMGYRRWRLHLDDTSLSVNGNVDFKGPYAGIYWSF